MVISAPPPSGPSPRSFPGRGPFLPTCCNGDPSGERAGPGAGAGNPKKTRPALGSSARRGGEFGRGTVFSGAQRPRSEHYALHQGLRGEVGRNLGDQVCIYHGHPGQAAGEGDSRVGHCVYREVVRVRGRGAGETGGGFSDKEEVNQQKSLGVGS